MPELTDEQWRSFSEHLDLALRMQEAERGPWLAALATKEPSVAAQIERKLSALAKPGFAGFLSQSPLTDNAPPQLQLVGREVGGWLVEGEIGQGPLGTVWRARRSDGRSKQRAAIKLVERYWPGSAAQARFRGRGRQFGRLDHPGIARLLDGGLLDKSQPYLVLEYVEGEPIDAYCDRMMLDVPARVTLFRSVLAAVGHAHSHLVLHRCLKPSNILVADDGAVKVLDFGIAELLSEDAAAAATHTYSLALAPQFAAPEQLSGHPISAASDVYSAALVLYRLLTGIPPRRADGSSAEQMRSAIHESPARASSVAPPELRQSLAGDLDAILTRALEQDPVRRYRSVDLLDEDLRRYLAHEPVQAWEAGARYRVRKLAARHRVALPVMTAVGLSLLVGGLYCLLQWQTVRLERDVALNQARRLESQCPLR